jgi:hypothetical protein
VNLWITDEEGKVTDTDEFAGFSAAPAEDEFAGFVPAPSKEVSPDETAGRVGGLATRALGEGVADTGSMITDAMEKANPLSGPLQAVQAAVPTSTSKEPSLSDFIHPARWKNAVDYLADKAGLASPQTPNEKIGSKAVEALPSAVLAPEAPIAGGISAAMGAGASEAVKQGGGSPLAQTLTGLAAGSTGAAGAAGAAGLRGIVRGGAEGQAAMQGRMADAAASGTKLSAGQAGGSPAVQFAEGLSSKGWGGGPINKLAETQSHDLGNSVSDIVDRLAGGNPPSPTAAGVAINTGASASVKNMRAEEKTAYDRVDALVDPDMPVDVSKSVAAARGLATPTSSEGLNAAVGSAKVSKFADALESAASPADVMGGLGNAAPKYMIKYGDLSKLRSAVGSNIDHGFAPANPSENGAFKSLYGSLTGDKNAGAAAVSPEASQAVANANNIYKINVGRRELLDTVVDKNGGPEAVFQAATNGTKQGATKISGVMNELDPGQQNLVRATVMSRLGKATAGAQNAEGDVFSPSTYLTNWNKLAPEAKDALFGQSTDSGGLRNNLDSLANTVSNIRQGTKLRNPSGTGEAVGHGAGAIAMWEGLTHLMQGDPHTLVAAAGGVGANNIMARALTNPKTVGWLAKSTKAPMSSLPNAVNQLSRINDPDAHDLAAYLQQPAPIARASGGKVDIDVLVNRLIKRWKDAKKSTDKSTEPLLRQPDSVIVRALEVAQQHL